MRKRSLRPNIEGLEGRQLLASVPTPAMVMTVPGRGVWRLEGAGSSWEQLNTQDAAIVKVDPYGDVVADFPNQNVADYRNAGVYLYTDETKTWSLIMAMGAVPQALDIAGHGNVVIVANGVYRYTDATSLVKLRDASLVDRAGIDAAGDVVVNELPTGILRYTDATQTWTQMRTEQATALAVSDNGFIAAQLYSASGLSTEGLYRYDPATATWLRIYGGSGSQENPLSVNDSGVVVASYPYDGVSEYTTAMVKIHPSYADSLVIGNTGLVVAVFDGYSGVYYTTDSKNWVQLVTSTSPSFDLN